MTALEVGVVGFLIVVVVVLACAWCFPGVLGAAKPPKWRGWFWDGKDE